MAEDCRRADPAPAFCYHLGDVVYYHGELAGYRSQFYEPYRDYPPPMVAIPGNHDGDAQPGGEPPLSAFARTFCSERPAVLPEAGDSRRATMVQPNVYWTLRAPLFAIVGLYSNVPDGGDLDAEQLAWLVGELRAAPAAALIVAIHHPPYSSDAVHGGSERIGALLDEAFAAAGRVPHLVLSGHVHSYQRFRRELQGREVLYLVAGAGGYPHLHPVIEGTAEDARLEAYADESHGFLRIAVGARTIEGAYLAVPEAGRSPGPGRAVAVDRFSIDLP